MRYLFHAIILLCTAFSAEAAPRISEVVPAPGAVTELKQVTVTFSGPVQGVDAEDLLVNNTPAAAVAGSGASYTFSFVQPNFGAVDFTWDAGHFIQEFGEPATLFDAEAADAKWSYRLEDAEAPGATVNPPPGATLRSLSQVEVRFDEEVAGVAAGDLVVNGVPAASVAASGANRYVFRFPIQPAGPAAFSWRPGHRIKDAAGNAFVGGEWVYVVDPNLPLQRVTISEFLAAEELATSLKDENGELQDWIELFNPGTAAVNLGGWALTDDRDEPDLWTFPDVTIAPGGRLLVFASGKDRKTNPARLHTNFKLNNDGEYLALFNAESPRVAMTEFKDGYPEQRNDYSYGEESQGGGWRYFQKPTPGAANGSSAVTGVLRKPRASVERGYFEAPFTLTLTNEFPGASIRYTTNGSLPTATTGEIYSGPISIARTTVLRAAAYAANFLPSQTITHTYIFLDQVLRQPNNPPGFPVGPTVMAGYPSDYELDPEIVNSADYRDLVKPALQALPVLSIVLKTEDMFGAANGIYTHPLNRGPAWERPCSVEFIPQDGNGFQVNAGIQVQGNAAREPVKQPKHPFRLTFKGEYGPTKLNYKMFPDSPVDSFDTLILRADFNNSWLHWDPTQRLRGQRTRDAWMKDTMRAMGGLASHNRFVHLYINGLYWGIYEPTERPDGAFGASYLGGEKEDYDVVNEGAVVDGTASAYTAMLGISNLAQPANYQAMLAALDMTQFIDYMLLHFYVGHEDWGNNKNWYTVRPRNAPGGFKYVPWDGELVLGGLTQNRVSNPDVPSGLHTKLLQSAEYKLAFADRAQKHLFNEGALTPEKNADRWMNRARQMELPIVAESARWGDYRRDVHQYQSGPYQLYTRNQQWRAEQSRLLTSYFPNRNATLLAQLRTAGLYPAVAAPGFNQHGGRIRPGFELSISAPAGTIYYTTNGVDPRVAFTGEPAPAARGYAGPVRLLSDLLVKARVRSGTVWSALTEANFTTSPFLPPVRITEIMYNPEPPGDAFEFVEIQNFGGAPVEIGSFYLTGIDYVFPPNAVLQPGEIILLASGGNPAGFQQRYPEASVFGYFGGQLVNRGERLALVAADGRVVSSVDYKDDGGWPEAADGAGYSLEVIDSLADPDDPANWQASAQRNGTPGKPNSPPVQAEVLMTEFAAAGPGVDYIAISNRTSRAMDLAGWQLRKARSTNVFVFTNDSALPAGAQTIIDSPFPIDRDGETLLLLNAAGVRIDAFSFGPQVPGMSLTRSVGKIALSQSETASPVSLKINEWMANPLPGEDDWIELFNPSDKPVALRGLFLGSSSQTFEIASYGFVPAQSYVRLWTDENSGPNHVDFKLPAAGGQIAIYSAGGDPIDQVSYSEAAEGVSLGRYPDGADTIVQLPAASPRAANTLGFPLSATVSGGSLQLSWPALAGRRYRLETTPQLEGPEWTSLSELTAAGPNASSTAPVTGKRAFFRVVTVP